MLTVFLTEEPVTTETLPELPSAKSKLLILENHALATELGFALFLKAWALTRRSLVTVIGPEYFGDDCVGVEPSTV